MTMQPEHILFIKVVAVLLLIIVVLVYTLKKRERVRKYNDYLDKENWKLKEEITKLKKGK